MNSSQMSRRTPPKVSAALREVGANLQQWRRLNRLSIEDAAFRAGVSVSTLRRLEQGHGATLENFMRVAHIYRILGDVQGATDPLNHDRGRAMITALL